MGLHSFFESVESITGNVLQNEFEEAEEEQEAEAHERHGADAEQRIRHPEETGANQGPEHGEPPLHQPAYHSQENDHAEGYIGQHLDHQGEQVPELAKEHHEMNDGGEHHVESV
jgi:hypothetical protein